MSISPDIILMPHISGHITKAQDAGMTWMEYCELRRQQELQNAAYFEDKGNLIYSLMCAENAGAWQRRKSYNLGF
jgi:hypothetical protein